MTDSKEIEQLFQQFLQPYENQITQLQDEQKQKDIEICTLKHAIYNLSKIISNFENENQNRPKIVQIGKQPGKKEEEKKNTAAQRPNTSNPQLRPPTKKDEKNLKTPISDKYSSVHSEEKQDPDTISHKSDDKTKQNKKQGKKPVIQPDAKSPKKKNEEAPKVNNNMKVDKKKESKKDSKAKKEGKDIQQDKKEKKEQKEDKEKQEEKKNDNEEQEQNDKEEEEIL